MKSKIAAMLVYLLGSAVAAWAIKITLFTDIDTSAIPRSPAVFGPVIERTLTFSTADLLDLDTGQTQGPIAQGTPQQHPQFEVFVDFGADAKNNTYPILNAQFLLVVRATNWDARADELEAALGTKEVPARTTLLAAPRDPLPVTYWFRTRSGNLGAFQVLGFTKDPPDGVRIRYRLLKANR